MTHPKTPCTCHEHKDGAPTTYGEHEFARDWDEAVSVSDDVFEVWRWLCSCGGRGHWQAQSGNVAYHAWLRHVEQKEVTQ